MFLVQYGPVDKSSHRRLNRFLYQDFLIRTMARQPAGLKKTCQRTDEIYCRLNVDSAQLGWLGPTAMHAASAVTTLHWWAGGFLDWSQRPWWKGSLDGVNGYDSVTKPRPLVGGHRLWPDLERDGLIEDANSSPTFSHDMGRKLLRCSFTLQP